MAATLFIRTQEDLNAPVDWIIAAPGSLAESSGRGVLAELDRPPSATEVVVLVPGIRVSLFEVDIPTRNRNQLLRAVPFALEEEIAGDVEQLHFAVKTGAGGSSLALAVERAWFESLLDRLADVDIKPTAIVPDTLCLPQPQTGPVLLLEDDRCSVRSGAWSSYVLDSEHSADGLISGDDGKWQVFDARTDNTPELGLSPQDIESREEISNVLAWLASEYREQRPASLLQGDFAVQSAWSDTWKRWRLVAGLMTLVAGVYMADLALENHQLAKDRQVLDEEMTTLFKAAFPDAVRVIDPAVQMRNRLKALREQSGEGLSGFLDLVGDAGKLILADDKVDIRLMRYRNGRLEMDLQTDSIERLEAVQTKLREANLDAELKSVRGDAGRFQGRLTLGRESAS